ncbi:type II 3-dehydroquinate dehydratase [Pseudothermotoga thermarum]|uniref:3-dehydroquinate dehydratase n=1 Tax=Pseudothermotoga thermarum DSM 5069 TaxID=688269 RepID=F7YWY8_9THEM|nr:type II 3-dehydroquinate dehydratase [Pseudothermotoga thermarum]AEH50580.1 3-dehydroquinate dehydratase [Pseudothermotoga thermarum DSM 5069]
MNILVIHGPNLNLLGIREPHVYGRTTLEEINQMIQERARQRNVTVKIVQYSSEGDIIDEIHRAREWADGIVINPGAYTHYSIAIRDALSAVNLPTVEVHISNIFKREKFRHKSVISPVVDGVISGLGYLGYLYAIDYLVDRKKLG